jgi:uncharacterized protein (TIGR04255 family)
MDRLRELELPDYPKRKPRLQVTGNIKTEPEFSPSFEKQELGFMFTSPEHSYVFQARIDGFTLSKLKPYVTWEPFVAEAMRLWKMYKAKLGACEVGRLAVRFVNRIDIPLPMDDLGKYLHTLPRMSQSMAERGCTGFILQLQIPQDDIGAVLNFREALVSPPEGIENLVSIVLDIDIFRDRDVPQNDDEIWAYFNEKLRQRKNEVFFEAITSETEQLFRAQEP